MSFATLHRAARVFGLPDFVKEAEFADPEDLKGLPKESFADPDKRRYPCHTKSACWLSNAKFWESALFDKQANESVGRNLLKMAKFWDIGQEVKTVIDKVAAQHGQYTGELPDASYALVFEHGGRKHRYFPCLDSTTTKTAATQFIANQTKFPYGLRKQAALKIMEKAANFGVEVEPTLRVYKSNITLKGATKQAMVEACMQRANLLYAGFQKELSTQLTKTASAIWATSDDAPVDKVLTMLDRVDRETGLYQHYGKGLELPELTSTEIVKAASAGVALTTGTRIPLDVLAKHAEQAIEVMPEYRDALVNDKGEIDMDKVAEILPTMPRPDAVMFEQAIMAAARG
jgi:hypothetical protein